jgi:probable phosphoglycerate mutase
MASSVTGVPFQVRKPSTVFLFIRHGEPRLTGKLLGRGPDPGLSDNGRTETANLARALGRLDISSVYSSPRQRALQTAEIIGSTLGVLPVVCPALDELDYGNWTGSTISNLDRSAASQWLDFNRARSLQRIPQGEWMIEGQTRVVSCLTGLLDSHRGRQVAIVSHSDVIKAALLYYLGLSLNQIAALCIPYSSCARIESDPMSTRITLCSNNS